MMLGSSNKHLSEFASQHFLAEASRVGGREALPVVRRIMETARAIYRSKEARTLDGAHGLVIVAPVPTWGTAPVGPPTASRSDVEALSQAIGPNTVVWLHAGRFAYGPVPPGIDLLELSAATVVYVFQAGEDCFIIRGTKIPVMKAANADSAFEFPAFKELRAALEHYAVHLCRDSTCRILREAWYGSGRRLLANKPEKFMRNSLEQFLRGGLRDFREIMPEQNVDESKPVDIKVTWDNVRRIALLEIKWLGLSVNDGGAPSTAYTAVRARSGAKQLADYMDRLEVRSGENAARGYLVVFDARRGGDLSGTPTAAELWLFEHEEIDYDPTYHTIRDDFEEPLRFYLRPA